MKKVLSVILAVVLVMGIFPIAYAEAQQNQIKNIIYMIPDGGGMVPLELASAVKEAGGLNNAEKYPYVTKTTEGKANLLEYLVGAIKTYSADNEVTDSAAAGTALSSGYKTKNGYVGVDKSLRPHATILEACQLMGKATGMVTTYDWANATPASFSSHDNSRSNNGTISEQVVNQKIDVVLGVGFDMSGWSDISEAEKRNYKIINNREDLQNVKKGDKIWGNLENREFPYDANNTAETVKLAEMTKGALAALSDADEDGFFLMVEGSRVDGAGHGNDTVNMVGDFLAFDEAFRIAVEYAKGRTDTIVVVCPDHDTGGMILPEDTTSAIEIIQNREYPEDIAWESKNHTARNGGLFIYAPEGISYPEGIDASAENPFEENVIDNTDVVKYIMGILDIDGEKATSELFVDVTDMGKYNGALKAFVFNNYPVTARRNSSFAYVGDKAVDLDGQVCVYINDRFYVPQMLLDIIEGTKEAKEYNASPVLPTISAEMKTIDDISTVMNIKSFIKDKSFSGKIRFSRPENFAALGDINFAMDNGKTECSVNIEGVEFNKNGDTFVYEIILENGKIYSFTETVSGILYGVYTDKPIVVDGVIDEAEWEYAPKYVCDDVTMLTNDFENWKGFRDLSAVFSVLYDKEYLYFCAVVTDEIFHQDRSSSNMWEADCIQFGFYEDTQNLYKIKDAGTRYDGINFGHIAGEDIAYRSQRVNYLVDKGDMEQGETLRFKTNRVINDMTYEIKMSWKDLMGYDLQPESGDMLAFSFLVNDNDGEDRRGAIQYGSGIYGGKNVNQFVPLYLFNAQGFENADGKKAKELNIRHNDEIVNLTNAYITDGKTMVPAEEFLSAAGIEWKKEGANIVIGGEKPMTIGEGASSVEGGIDATYSEGTLYMPLRAVCEGLGKTVFWRQNTTGIYIK